MQAPLSMGRRANPGTVGCDYKITIGTTGAVAKVRGMWLKDSAPPVRQSAGQYLMTFDRTPKELVCWTSSMLQQGTEILEPVVLTDTTSTNGQLVFQTRNGSGSPTDPTSGDIIYISIVFDEQGLQF